MTYTPSENRYEVPQTWFRRCGGTGLKISALTFGLWQNFGEAARYDNDRAMVLQAFDLGITYFDMANNYGNPRGAAETTFGKIFRNDLAAYRDEILIVTKAGYAGVGNGPYGGGGSRKHILASLDTSLKRLGVDYVDVFFMHCFDENVPLEETFWAYDHLVRQGKVLYIGFSTGYDYTRMKKVVPIVKGFGPHGLVHMMRYSMFNREYLEGDLQNYLVEQGVGSIAFSALAEGALTDKYLAGIPADTRAKRQDWMLEKYLNPDKLKIIRQLNDLALQRGQSLAQMSLAWVMRTPAVTAALIGASRPEQIQHNAGVRNNMSFTADELKLIEAILAGNAGAATK